MLRIFLFSFISILFYSTSLFAANTTVHKDLTGANLHQPFAIGVDSAKSASPKVGDHYYGTDSKALYQCQVNGTWTIILEPNLTISSNGNVGVGTTTNINQTLTVKGNVSIETGGSTLKPVCWKAGGILGYCADAPNATTGNCTCN